MPHFGRRSALAAACVVAAALAVPYAISHRTTIDGTRPNVVVVLVDTLRADRVGWQSTRPSLTPFLDSIAAQAAVFTNAYAASSWTTPSITSLFTSRYPSQHGQIHFASVLPAKEVTLADVLRRGGYVTAAVSGHGGLAPRLGLTRGFGLTDIISGPDGPRAKAPAAMVTADALQWMDRRSAAERATPFFLYVHYMEPHAPYTAAAATLERILARHPNVDEARRVAERVRDDIEDATASLGLPRTRPPHDHWGEPPLSEDERQQGLHDLYDAEVLEIDQQLERLFAGLRERGALDDAVVVFVADHGEELYEHGGYGHGNNLFEESIRVPLLIWQTKRNAPVRIRRIVSLIDVAPTLVDYARLPVPEAFEGRSLAPLIASQGGWGGWVSAGRRRLGLPPRGIVFSELYAIDAKSGANPARAIVNGGHKLIADGDGTRAVFDLDTDPGEQAAVRDTAARQQLETALNGFVANVARKPIKNEVRQLDEGTRQRLRALGYGSQ
jgi:arylsulfatase A-like enzyme